MLLLRIYFHLISFIKIFFYKLIYRKRLKIGRNVSFRKGFSLIIEKDGYVEIGDGCFFNNYCSINSHKSIVIGKNCLFGEGVKIYDHNHVFKFENELIKNQGFKTNNIKINDNCWIGSNVVILKDVEIGKHSIIAAGEIVKKNVNGERIFINSNEENIRLEKK